MRWRPKLNPITERRLKRFRGLRRAYCSFWLLVGLYIVSLLANILSNDKPLFVSKDGEWYFPVFFFYPDDDFTGSGLLTRPDYKLIRDSEEFRNGEGNFMIFPPIPYGPLETLEPGEVEYDETVEVVISKEQRVASLNLDSEFAIARSQGAGSLFEIEDERGMIGKSVSDFLPLDEDLAAAVAARLSNDKELPAIQQSAETMNGMKVSVSLTPYRPRARPPSSVRLTIREIVGRDSVSKILLLEDGNLESDEALSLVGEGTQEEILDRARQRRDGLVDDFHFEKNGSKYEVSFEKEQVRFPFRPTDGHPFGLDNSGRDVLSRILYGLRISLNFSLLLVFVTMAVGVVLGGIQGFKGGMVDLVGQRFTEIWESLPFLYIMILMGSVFGRHFMLLLVVYGLFNWIGISYYMRGEFLKLRKQPFVEAAHSLGLPESKIMLRHILPNALVPLVTFFPFSLVGAIFSLSALDYLGFGLPPPTPSWGELLSQGQEFKESWWLVLYPSLALFVVILLAVFIGEGVRAAFDPRVNSRYES